MRPTLKPTFITFVSVFTFLTFILLTFSCNNEEIFVVEDSVLLEVETEDEPNNEDENNLPVIEAVNDDFTTSENLPLEIKVYDNDKNLSVLRTVSNTNPVNGILSIDDNETPDNYLDDIILYTPNSGYFGIDSFEYTLCDNATPEHCSTAIVTIVIEEVVDNIATELKAFPTAYGAASYVTGGRGGKIYHVTNLNNEGAGSFRDAVSESNRIIVFDVSGTIDLTNSLDIYADNITIAGQTAPEGGITITGQRITQDGCDNWIVRYLKVRPKYSSNDAWSMIHCSNFIIDHCSVSWGGDEILTFRGDTNNLTIQRTLIGEGKTGSIYGDSDNPSRSQNLSFINNAYYNVTHRHPNIHSDERADILNNIVYNWKYRLSRTGGDIKLNHIGNYYSMGCLNSFDGVGFMLSDSNGYNPSLYTNNNIVTNNVLNLGEDNWKIIYDWLSDPAVIQDTKYKASNMFPILGASYELKDGLQTFEDVSSNCGANAHTDNDGKKVFKQDPIDKVYLDNIIQGDCVSYESSSKGQNYTDFPHYIDFLNSISTAPLNSRANDFDTDMDGMADAWEITLGLDVNVDDSAGDIDGDGYTNIEEYINQVDF